MFKILCLSWFQLNFVKVNATNFIDLRDFSLYSYFICDLGTVKLLARGGGESVLNCFPRATVQNTIPDTEGQLFDCFEIPNEKTVIFIPDQLKKKEEVYSFCKYVNNRTFSVLQLWRQIVLGKQSKLLTGQQFKGNTLWRHSMLVKQSKLLPGQQFAFVDCFRISENSNKYQITFI